jgi:putative peptidoglycan lipid II flippase
MRSSAQKILRSAALVAGLALLAKITGLVLDVIVAAQFGTSPEMDAFLVAATISSLLFVWLNNPIRVIFVPFFSQNLATLGERVAWENASTLMNTSIILFFIIAAVGWLLSPFLVWLVAPGFSQEMSGLAADLTRLTMLTVVFLGLAKILSGVFHSYERFGWPGMVGTVDNFVNILLIVLLAPSLGIYALAVGTVLGTMVQALVQTSILWKFRSYYKPQVDLKNPTLHRMARVSLPLFIGASGTRLGKVTDRIFASFLQPGSLSALTYGHRLTYTAFELFVDSLTTVLFPFFSKAAAVEGYEDFGKKLSKSLRMLFWIIFPLSIGILLLHEPLVRLVYQRGAFDENSVKLTGQAVFFYAIGLWAYSLSNVLSFAFYSLQKTKAPVVIGLVRLGIKILLSSILVGSMGHAGLALAESLSFMVKTVLLFVFLPAELREQTEYPMVFASFGMTVVATGAMGVVVFFVLPIFEKIFEVGTSLMAVALAVGTAITFGVGSYLIFSLLIQSVELKDFYKLLRSGFAKVLPLPFSRQE